MELASEIESEFVRFYKARRTVFQMCHDRSYLVSQAELDTTFDEFDQQFGQSNISELKKTMPIIVHHIHDKDDQMIIFFHPNETNLGVKDIKKYLDAMKNMNFTKAIIVCPGKMTSQAIKALKNTEDQIETFLEEELLFNVTRHELVPKHILLTDEEKQQLLDRYKVTLYQLPRILTTDVIARYYGYTKGQVVKILRPSDTAGYYVNYRAVL